MALFAALFYVLEGEKPGNILRTTHAREPKLCQMIEDTSVLRMVEKKTFETKVGKNTKNNHFSTMFADVSTIVAVVRKKYFGSVKKTLGALKLTV